MAFRFRREGDFIKHRTRMNQQGMQPWIEDFKWRAVDWQYKFYMTDKATNAIRSNQKKASEVQWKLDQNLNGESLKGLHMHDVKKHAAQAEMLRKQRENLREKTSGAEKHAQKIDGSFQPDKTRYFVWRPFLPNIVPNVKSSNPFCRASSNSTGWIEPVRRRIKDPQPIGGKHVVAGTVDSVPVFPKYV